MIEMTIQRRDELDYLAVEAINVLCTNLSFASENTRKIMLTSCQPREGKSFIAMNLMLSLAKLGMRVVLVDADIRASVLQKRYGIHPAVPEGERYWGLSGYLAGRCGMEDIVGSTNVHNAYLVLSGPTVNNSLPFLNTGRMSKLLDSLAQQFDIVLVDTPPIGTIIDAARIATWCDGTVFLVQSGSIAAERLRKASAQIEKAGCPILGYVLNKCPIEMEGRADDYYRYYYGSRGQKSKRRTVKKQ